MTLNLLALFLNSVENKMKTRKIKKKKKQVTTVPEYVRENKRIMREGQYKKSRYI